MQFQSSTVIDAPAHEVWSVLVDLDHWPSWDSDVVRTQGRLAPGERVTLWSAANPKRGFHLRVTTFEPPNAITLRGGLPLGLFAGVRTYRLAPDRNGGTHFVMREVYTGPLRKLIGRTIPDLQPSFDTFTAGLKKRVETDGSKHT